MTQWVLARVFEGGQERMDVAIYRTTCLDEGETRDRFSTKIGLGGGVAYV